MSDDDIEPDLGEPWVPLLVVVPESVADKLRCSAIAAGLETDRAPLFKKLVEQNGWQFEWLAIGAWLATQVEPQRLHPA